MARTLVHLVRHGEVYNPDAILYGRLPGYHLSELGRQMAQRLAQDFTSRQARIVYVAASPLERAQQTAAPTAEAFDLEVGTDERVIEAGSKLQGQPISAQPTLLLKPENLKHLFNPFKPSWGGSYLDVVGRMVHAVKEARNRAEGAEAVRDYNQSTI